MYSLCRRCANFGLRKIRSVPLQY